MGAPKTNASPLPLLAFHGQIYDNPIYVFLLWYLPTLFILQRLLVIANEINGFIDCLRLGSFKEAGKIEHEII